jgi:3-methyladenine DNA glycosylase AlkD
MDPICPPAHNDLSLLLAEDGQFDHYISHAKEYIKWTRSDKIWQQLFTIALVLLEIKKEDEAAALLDWIIESKFKNKFIAPSSIRVKADKVYKAFCAPPQN